MNYTLWIASIVVFMSLENAYVSKTIWGEVYGRGDGYTSHELSMQAAEEGKGRTGVLKDPVCGMEVSDPEKAPSYVHEGMVYYFCSEECMKKFKKAPSNYPGK